ncbi:MAG TPA: patatin-like phospholipase family protein [Longimicrobiales bacterium]|nr:patatin-like phospholipase family protein [Longimicrobiales bacterium]
MNAPASPPLPDKLGLALAGGGFRASLFHVGVLHRLAELDVLRHVQVLSTVSGGSITGALYALRLKKWLEDPSRGPRLSRQDYVALVREVDELLCDGIAKNLRTRLFLNPITTLRVLLTHDSMGRAMARLYERHIFHEAVLRPAGAPRRELSWLGRRRERGVVKEALELGNLRVRPHGADVRPGLDAYNAAEEAAGDGSVLTRWIVNATSLNSGGRFFFSAVELGDWYLGAFRRDEVKELLPRRQLLLEGDVADLVARVEAEAARAMDDPDALARLRTLSLALRWRLRLRPEERASKGGEESAAKLEGWEALRGHTALRSRFPGDLEDCALGLLRQLKLAAWYLRFGYERTPQITGGRSRKALWRSVLALLGDIDRELTNALREAKVTHDDPAARLLCEFIVELYLLRTADRVSPHFHRDWERLSVSDAVGASACFPPVFPPLVLLGLYDDAHVTRLGLTDGGVYDNAGITALLDEGCTSIIASDTGGVFDERPAAPPDHVGLTLRLPSILTRAVGGLQRFGLRERKRISRELADLADSLPATPDCDSARAALAQTRAARELHDVAYFQIASPAPSIPVAESEEKDHAPPIGTGLDPRRVAGLRTDLDGFGEAEIAALLNQGYDTADRFARGFMQRYARDDWNRAKPALPRDRVGGARIDRVLDAGASRFLRALRLGAPLSVAIVALAGAGLITLAVVGTGPADLWSAARFAWTAGLAAVLSPLDILPVPLADAIRWVPRVIPDIVLPWLGPVLATPVTIGLVGAGLLALLVRSRRERRPPERRQRFVPMRTTAKWLSSLRWNVLWLAWALPLLIAAASTLWAASTWALFFLPWRHAARIIRPGDVVVAPRPEPVDRALQLR